MKFSYYFKHIKKTKGRYDVTPLFRNPAVFAHLIHDLTLLSPKRFDVIVGIDALGFILASALALKLKKGFVPVRKGGKLPAKKVLRTSFTDYSGKKKALEMNLSSIKAREKVLIVDEWIETGAQVTSAIKLVEKQKGVVVGILAISAEKDEKTKIIFQKYNCQALNTERC